MNTTTLEELHANRNTGMRELSPVHRATMIALPETGMGYQLASAEFDDGSTVNNLVVINSSYIITPQYLYPSCAIRNIGLWEKGQHR